MIARDAAIDEALAAQRRLMQAMHASADPAWLHLDLTMGQLKALFALADAALSVGRLADRMGLSQPTVSQLVDRLVQLGLAARTEDPDDRRRACVSLTEQGRARITRLREGGEDRWRALLGQLADEDLAAWTRGLEALARVAAERLQPAV
jgi:MarR family transcriptional regulator, organic hydroperoxide resistance regulator